MSTNDAVTVTAAEFHRNVGVYQDIALTEPVTITNALSCCRRKNMRARSVATAAPLQPASFRSVKSTPFATPEFRTNTLISIKKSKTEDRAVSGTVRRSGHPLFLPVEAGA
jgi:hypothetical protein